jgi:hypothetical protein
MPRKSWTPRHRTSRECTAVRWPSPPRGAPVRPPVARMLELHLFRCCHPLPRPTRCPATRSEPPAAPLLAATASARLWPAACQIDLATTLPCPYQSLPTAPRPLHRAYLAGTQAAAATRPGRRRRPSPTPSPAQSTPGIGPLGPKAPPPAGPDRRLAGIWPDRRRSAA